MYSFFRYVFLICFIVSLLTACSDEQSTEGLDIKTVRVDFNLSMISRTPSVVNKSSKLSKSSSIEKVSNVLRGDAPIEVKGVEITAVNQDFFDENNDPITTKGEFTFTNFGNVGGESISMEVPLGRNEFTAETTSVEALSKAYTNEFYQYQYDWSLSEADDYKQKIKYYTNLVNELQPVYAVYKGNVSKTITDKDNSVNIPMSTESCRFNIIIETSWQYEIVAIVQYRINGVRKTIKTNTRKRIENGYASAIVLNDKDLTENTYITIKLQLYKWNDRRNKFIKVRKKHIVKDGSRNYKTERGVNKTLIINYNASENY